MQRTYPVWKTAVITGAAGGIGQALVAECRRRDMRIVAVGRNDTVLRSLDEAGTGAVVPVALDLLQDGAIAALVDRLARSGIEPDLLVNCAGAGLLSPFDSTSFEAQRRLCRLNLEVPTELTYRLLPGLKQRRGAVLNIASLLAYVPAANLAMLAASKAALLNWSVALRRELHCLVSVTAFCPGITRTGFLATAGMQHLRLAEGPLGAEPGRVARAALAAVEANAAVGFTSMTDRLAAMAAGLLPAAALAAITHAVLRPDPTVARVEH